MADPTHLDLLKEGITAWNQWRRDNYYIIPDLRNIDLEEMNLEGFNFRKANLEDAVLKGANLDGADLTDANLAGAILVGTHFNKATLYRADLRRVDLREAWLDNAELNEAQLTGANLSKAVLSDAQMSEAKLESADLTESLLARAELPEANLSEARLNRAVLHEVNFSRATLYKADMREAILVGANFYQADLREVDLQGANLRHARFERTDLQGAHIHQASLQQSTFIESIVEQAILTESSIYGISVWNLKGTPKDESNLIISRDDEPIITVDDLQVAQFIYLLLNHKKLRNVLNSITQRGVLILGRFGDGGLVNLQSIAAKLRTLAYLPIIFDFDRPDDRNYTETIKTLAGLSRFIIADLSGPSVPQELYATVPHFKVPFVPILELGRKQFAMSVDLFEYPWVLPLVRYSTTEQLIEVLPSKIIEPAEKKHRERQVLLEQLFGQ
jgi:uncharacterized protein YjbI with pentapeptide repeats